MWYDVGIFVLGAMAGSVVAIGFLFVLDLNRLPDDVDAALDDGAYRKGVEDGKRMAEAEAKAKRRAAGLKAAQTRKLGDAIVGAEE